MITKCFCSSHLDLGPPRPATASVTPRHALIGAWESMHSLLSPHSFAIVDHGADHPPNQAAGRRFLREGSAPHPP